MSTNRRDFLKLSACSTGASVLGGCTGRWTPEDSYGRDAARPNSLAVVATTGMIADMVRSIGGDAIRLTQLISAGVDPHLYKPMTS